MLIIVFGLSGSGKNSVSKILVDHYGFYYCDADALLPQSMLEAIKNEHFFTQSMRDELTQNIIRTIAELQKSHPNLVVAQGLYKNKNRQEIATVYPDAKFLLVETAPEIRKQRLSERADGIAESYADAISMNFEKPTHPHILIANNSDESAILKQLLQQLPTIAAFKVK